MKIYSYFCTFITSALLIWCLMTMSRHAYFLATSLVCTEATENQSGSCHTVGNWNFIEDLRTEATMLLIGKTAVIANLRVESSADTVISARMGNVSIWFLGSEVKHVGKTDGKVGVDLSPEYEPMACSSGVMRKQP